MSARDRIVDRSIITKDMPDLQPITDKTREENKQRKFTGGVRIGRGIYRTDEEERLFKENALARKLP